MVSAESFWTTSLRADPDGGAITRILAAAIQAVEPAEAVSRFVHRRDGLLHLAGQDYDLASFRRVQLLGLGKAAPGMMQPLVGLLAGRLADALLVSKHVPGERLPGVSMLQGGHPLPDEHSLAAGRRVAEFLAVLAPGDLLICLISGGASALASLPHAGISLSDLQGLTSALLACGARVDEINTLRRRLDRLKGGGLLRLANGASVVALILSDVIGNPLEAIASGPTAPDPSSRAEAIAILRKYHLLDRQPESILSVLRHGPETLKAADPQLEKVRNVLVGSNLLAAQAALKQAGQEGFHPYLLRTDLQGEARQAAFELATFLRHCQQTGEPAPPPACIVAGGETTVSLHTPPTGRGGRNTELALAAAIELAGFPGARLISLATDGEDGPTDAAGAVVSGGTFARAKGLGLDAHDYLSRNDSYTFFLALGDLLRPGPTGTNVNDLTFLLTG